MEIRGPGERFGPPGERFLGPPLQKVRAKAESLCPTSQGGVAFGNSTVGPQWHLLAGRLRRCVPPCQQISKLNFPRSRPRLFGLPLPSSPIVRQGLISSRITRQTRG